MTDPTTATTDPAQDSPPAAGRGLKRFALAVFAIIAVSVIWVTNALLTERFSETTRNRADVRLTLFVGTLISELQRNSIVPQLLARDQELIGALNSRDYSRSTQRLLSFVDEIGAASLVLFDAEGRIVAATDRNRIGEVHADQVYFRDAIVAPSTVFTAREMGPVADDLASAGYSFIYSRAIMDGANLLGVIAVEVDLARLERNWAAAQEAVIVMDGDGRIVLAGPDGTGRDGTGHLALAHRAGASGNAGIHLDPGRYRLLDRPGAAPRTARAVPRLDHGQFHRLRQRARAGKCGPGA
jgi:two-component system, NtrC family, C4-dicarboxylate transport sensor histidine kinase DctB